MISTNFYPDDSNPGNQGMLITKSVYNLNITDVTVDPMAAYYMGQIMDSQDLCYKAKFEIGGGDVQSDYVYKVVPDRSVKPNWGYCYNATGSNMDKITWNNGRYYGNLCFINSMEWYKVNLASRNYYILLFLYDFSGDPITLGNGEQIRQATNISYAYLTTNPDALYEFYKHGAAFNVTMGGNSYALTLDKWDYENNFFDVGDNKRVYVRNAVLQVGSLGNCFYYNNWMFGLNVMYSIDMPTAIAPYYGAKYYSNVLECYARDTRIDVQYNRINAMSTYGGTSVRFTQNMDLIMETKPFELSYIAINYACTHQSGTFLNSKNDLYSATSDVQVQVNYFIDFVDWLKRGLGCSAKWCTGHKEDGTSMTTNYNSDVYLPNHGVPLFTGNNSPTTVLKFDKYKNLEPWLQPWQKYGYDINDNDYDPDSDDPSGGSDSTDDTDIPDKDDGKDGGTPPGVDSYSSNYSMTKFVTMNSAAWESLKTGLSQAVAASAADPTNTSTLAYKLGSWKSDGTFEAANELSIMKFIASARFYPFDVSYLQLGNGSYLVDTSNPDVNLSFGYRGASVPCSNMKLNYNIASLKIMTIKVPTFKGGAQEDTNDVTFEEFEPFTKYTLMLPFIGEMNIPAHNAIRATIGIRYLIDFNSGTCAAIVMATGGFNQSTEIIGCMSGTCSTGISIAGNDAVSQGDKMAAATLNKQSTELALSRAKFDFAYSVANATINAAESEVNSQAKGFAPGIGAAQSAFKSAPEVVHGAMNIESAKIGDKLADINCTQAQRSVPTLLNFGSNASGNICINQPCLKIERTLILRGEGYKHTYGWPTYQKRKLSTVEGYFECANPDVSGITGEAGAIPSEIEMKMINDALRSGSIMK